jgi:arginine utilization regulatory protein
MNEAVDKTILESIMGPSRKIVGMIFDALPLGVVIADAGGVVAYYNQTQLKIDGLTPRDVTGRFLADIYSPYASSIILNCLAAQRPILDHWQLYDSPTVKNIQAISNALPLFNGGRLSGCISFTRSFPKTDMDSYLSAAGTGLRTTDPMGNFGRLIGRSPSFIMAVKAAEAASANHLPVLIHGETGVGKELFAKGIHNSSPRANQPFVAVNCSAIPDNLFEGLMFGISRGSFTGAIDKAGFFEEANGGTMYLDEIDSLPLSLQPKVLRVVQEGEVRRLGSERTIRLNVKIISSMSQDPLKMVELGRFRSDLFYRLGAIIINIPSLRARLDDLPLLVEHFIFKYSDSLGKKVQRVSHDFMRLLQKSTWPGNVRELEHVITGAITLARPRQLTIGTGLMPEYFKNSVFYTQNVMKDPSSDGPGATGDSAIVGTVDVTKTMPPLAPYSSQKQALRQGENRIICGFLAQSFGNVSLAARLMGLSPQSLHYKIKRSDINVEDFKRK